MASAAAQTNDNSLKAVLCKGTPTPARNGGLLPRRLWHQPEARAAPAGARHAEGKNSGLGGNVVGACVKGK